MIVIEPASLLASLAAAPGNRTGRAATVGKRVLSSFLRLAAETVGVKGQISVLLTDDATLRSLNRQFRKQDKATDVLSFPAGDPPVSGRKAAAVAGDLAISLETAARQGDAYGHGLEIEVKVLLLHGVLHLAGLDHETDAGEMRARESGLRERFGLPSGLIERGVQKVRAKKLSIPAGLSIPAKRRPPASLKRGTRR